MEKRNLNSRYLEELIIIRLIINDVDDYLKAERLVKDLKETKHCFQIILGESVKSSMEVCCDALFSNFPKYNNNQLAQEKNFNQGKLFINKDNYFTIINETDFKKLPKIPQIKEPQGTENFKAEKELPPEQRYIVTECNSILDMMEVIKNGAFAIIIPANILQKQETKLELIVKGLKQVVKNSSKENLEKINGK